MTRRAIKKALRKAEEAFQAQRYWEARDRFNNLLSALEGCEAGLLDHAACIYGLIRALHALEETEAAIELAESAVDRLSHRAAEPVAA